jgi:hypothetical protein
MMDVIAPPPRSRAHANAPVISSHECASSQATHLHALPGLEGYLAEQSDRTKRLLEALDQGIHALAPDIRAQTTKGRRSVGGVSYYTPERLFFCADFLYTSDGLTLSVFTGGQHLKGLSLSRSAPWGYCIIRTEADLPVALTWAKRSYEARRRAP